MITLRLLAGAFVFAASTVAAQAQDGYLNTCEPVDIFDECQDLALRYYAGSAPFPYDPERAEALRSTVLKYALAECGLDFSMTDSCGKARDLIVQRYGRILPSTGLVTTGAQELLALRDLTEIGCDQSNPLACIARARFDYDTGMLLYRTQIARQSGDDPAEVTKVYEAEYAAYLGKAKTAAQLYQTRLNEDCNNEETSTCVLRDEMKQLLLDLETNNLRASSVLYPSFLDACLQGQTNNCVKLVSNIATLGLDHLPENGDAPQVVAARFERECKAGNGPACFSVALLLTTQERNSEDFYNLSCQMGVPHGCEAVAWQAYVRYSEAPAPETLAVATSLLQKACNMGRNVPCHVLEHLPAN
ncbi:hypothetical protein [Roseovarius albus]|uniref:hypothetical protein n=1 Tax=Roseovarius albus TaxID=1247867 RepID=UPI0013562972|nr:hypothetical protein [Roseovarius albus]